MILQITLGDIIGWFITLTSVGISVTVGIKAYSLSKKVNQKVGSSTGPIIGMIERSEK